MPTTEFHPIRNNVKSTLRAAHVVADGTLMVLVGDGARFGSSFPIRVTCERAADGVLAIFDVTARAEDDLTIGGVLEGSTDVALAAGDKCEMRITAGAIDDLQTAVNALEAGVGGVLATDGLAVGEFASVSGRGTTAVGDAGPRADGFASIASGHGCHATGSGSYAGYPRYACTIAGATVTIAGVDASGVFATFVDFGEPRIALTGLTGGTGPVAALTDLTAVSYAGGDTVLTLSEALTRTAGLVTIAAYVDSPGCFAAGGGAMATGNRAAALNSSTLASGPASLAAGRQSVAGLPGQWAIGGGYADGQAQDSRFVVAADTTDATPRELRFANSDEDPYWLFHGITSTLWMDYPIAIRPDFTVAFDVAIVARALDGTAHARFARSGLIRNNAGSTGLIGAVATVGTDINAPGWSVAIAADDTNDALKITVTGQAATAIRWVASVHFVEAGT